jgi:hypothetical protein
MSMRLTRQKEPATLLKRLVQSVQESGYRFAAVLRFKVLPEVKQQLYDQVGAEVARSGKYLVRQGARLIESEVPPKSGHQVRGQRS